MFGFTKKPPLWIAAHRSVDYTFDYDTRVITDADELTIGQYAGNMAVTYNTFFTELPERGDLIFITSGIYQGYHTIAAFALGIIITTTIAIGQQTTGNIKLVKSHIFRIYKGYTAGDMAAIHPYEQIAEFKPEPSPDGLLTFNICGYINKIFDTLNANDTAVVGAATIYPNLFNRITLVDMGTDPDNPTPTLTSQHIAANSALTTFELNRDYVDSGKFLNSGDEDNFYYSCGVTENISISGSLIIQDAQVYAAGFAPPRGSFSTAFSNSYNRPQ